MTTVTLNLPDSLLQRATKIAETMQRSMEEVLADTLLNSLPDVSDAPAYMQAELLDMSRLSDQKLMLISQSYLTTTEQNRLKKLSVIKDLNNQQQQELSLLQQHYGEITLRKAHAYALLSLRAGKPISPKKIGIV